MLINFIRARDDVDDAFADFLDHVRIFDFTQDHAKFIAAQTPADDIIPARLFQPCGNLRQQAIPDGVAQRIIDRFEPIKIDHQKGTTPPPCCRLFQRASQCFVDEQTVGQAGQPIKAGKVRDAIRRRALFGDIRPDATETGKVARCVICRRCGQFPPPFTPINGDGNHERGEAFLAVELVRQIMQGGREFAGGP